MTSTLEPQTEDQTEGSGPQTSRRRSPLRWLMWIAVAIVAAIALMYGAIFIYANVLNDAPDALDEGDLSEAIAEPQLAEPTDAAEPAVTTAPAEEVADVATESVAGFDGAWVPTDASEFGYRVDEVLSGVNVTAVGRSNEIAGDLVIDGTTADISVTVEVATIESDDSRRDSQFRGRIMNTAEFPSATFATTSPIDFGSAPAPGEQVTTSVAGDLTLKGVTRPVTFEVTAEASSAANGDRIGVLGSIPVDFVDYGIDNPSFGTISVEDDALLEFVLVFERS